MQTGLQLDSALSTASNNGQDDEIRISSGTIRGTHFAYGDVRWDYYARTPDQTTALDVSGGWNASCTAQSGQAADTVLDAESNGSALIFHSSLMAGASGLGGRISLRNLTIANASDTNVNKKGIALDYLGDIGGGQFIMERVAIVGSDASYTGSGASGTGRIVRINQSVTGQVKLVDNVIAANVAMSTKSSIVHVACSTDSLCYVNNNSIHDNYVGDDATPFALTLSGTISAANNVVASNTALNVLNGAQAGPYGSRSLTLRNNHFESDWFNGEYLEQGTTNGAPKWTKVGLYRFPDPVSPLRNSGINNPIGGVGSKDIAGSARIQDAIVDRGAIEAAPAQNSGPTLQLEPQYTVSPSLPVGSVVFTAVASDDGLPGPLTFSFSQISCPNLLAVDNSGVVRLNATVPAGLAGCSLELQVSDGQYAALAQTVLLFDDRIFRNGFDAN